MKDISFLIEEWKVSKYSCFQFFISIFTLRSYRSFHVEEELIKIISFVWIQIKLYMLGHVF
jgi:hypothetical protein